MKAIKLLVFLLLSIALATTAFAAVIPATIDSVEVEGKELSPNADNPFSVVRGDKISVEVVLTAREDIKDANLKVEIDGFEYGSISDQTNLFDMKANVTYKKKLSLLLSDDMSSDYHKLRVRLVDKNHNTLEKEYNLIIDMPRHLLRIDDVVMTPENKIKPGSALLTTVRLENKGYKDQKDIKVKVSIPDLGLSAAEYVEEIESPDEEEGTEEIYLKIPRCAKAGIYDVVIEVIYNKGANKLTTKKLIEVLHDDACEIDSTAQQPKTTITVGSNLEMLKKGASAVFPITITNSDKTSKSYTLVVSAPDWARVKITPSSTIVLNAGATQTMYIFVEADNAPAGAQVLTATVSSGNEQLQQIPLTLNVVSEAKKSSGVKTFLEVVLVVLVVLLVIIALIVGFTKLKGNNEESVTPEKYY